MVTGTGGVTAAESGAKAGARSIGDRLFPYVGNGGYDVQSYDVGYDYRPDTTKMTASVRVDAVAKQDLSEFSLDAAGMKFKSVTVDGKPAAFQSQGEKLIITPARAVPNGKAFLVEVAYIADRSAAPPSPAIPDQTRSISGWYDFPGTGKEGFALLGQPDRAHLFFPMNDHPSDKARVTFRITVPKNLTAVANGTLRQTTTKGDRTTYVYGTCDPIPTHVVQAAVGPYKEITGTGPGRLPLRSYVPKDQTEEIRPQVDQIGKQVAWVQKTIGSAYPYETYGVLVPQEAYGAALETATLSTYGRLDEPSNAPIMVHELVHQYFGNAVSPKNWDDMWISEGHASYYGFRYQDEKEIVPLKRNVERAYEFDQEVRPEVGPPGRLKNPGDVLGSTNAAGIVMLYGLNRKVGDATFQNIEKTFFEKFRHKNASTEDYINVVNKVTGKDFTSYIKEWVYGKKTPPMPNA
ncbi:M1 family metallopeptidase [Streptomyces violascens]|uniref:M1 family metallopeptidase n=1 Tax=Streptomyces violascens TaxID=67381 RepID=UPI0036794ECE